MAVPASAQRNPDGSVNPTASSVKEDQLLQEFRIIRGLGTIPDTKSYNIEQPAGRDWRHFHQVTLRWIGAIAILGILAVLIVFYLARGMVRIESGRSGRVLVRFNAFERLVHWVSAACFVVLALSGLNISFGKALLAPLMAPETFTAWSQWAKYAHNYLSFPFTLGVVLIFPFYGTTIVEMQLAEIVHGVIAMLFIAAMLGHIYIGTIGMEGAFEGMWDGTVDVNWAKEHHSLWLEKEAKEGHVGASPSQGRMAPAE